MYANIFKWADDVEVPQENHNISYKNVALNMVDDFLSKTPEQQKKEFPVDAIGVEKYIIKLIGGKWNKKQSGEDGWINGISVEVKSQLYKTDSEAEAGPYKSRGRIKFGGCSYQIHDEKLRRNEIVFMMGGCDDGHLHHVFSCLFEDLSSFYLQKMPEILIKPYSNIDILPKHYKNKPSFRVHYINPDINNMLYSRNHNKQFTDDFYKFLNTTNIDIPLNEIKNYYK